MKSRFKDQIFDDNYEEEILVEAAKVASSKAIRTSKALGLTIQVIEGDQIISIGPDNSRDIVGTINRPERDLSDLKKGTILKMCKEWR